MDADAVPVYGIEELMRKEFGKTPKEMTKEELLLAISAVSNRLYKKTGRVRYKDTEDAMLCLLDGITEGLSDEDAVERTVELLKRRGYSEEETMCQ